MLVKANAKKTPAFIEPMKALSIEKLPEGDWLYEIKHDGYRVLAFKDGKDVRLISRNKKAFDYPQLLNALKKLPADRAILDGEIAALDEKGRSSFSDPCWLATRARMGFCSPTESARFSEKLLANL